MIIQYSVPPHLEPYLEYIPDNMLQEFVTNAIEAAINARNADEEKKDDFSGLLDKLGELMSTTPTRESKPEPEVEMPTYDFTVVEAEEDPDNSGGDNDLINDFLADICK